MKNNRPWVYRNTIKVYLDEPKLRNEDKLDIKPNKKRVYTIEKYK